MDSNVKITDYLAASGSVYQGSGGDVVMDNTCVCCGAVIPEGRMVCWACENGNGVSQERRANGTVGTGRAFAHRAALHAE